MSVKIRLARRGSKKRPFYDIVVIDSRKKRDGKPIEKLGYINPMLETETDQRKKIVINGELVTHWLKNGAIPTETVAGKLFSLGFKEVEKYLAPKKESIGISKKEKKKIAQEKAEIEKARLKAKAQAAKEAAAAAKEANAS